MLMFLCACLLVKLYIMLKYTTPGTSSLTDDAAAPDENLPLSLDSSSAQRSRFRRHAADPDIATRRAPEGGTRPVYVVTATYPRPEQEADLLRLSQTLMHVASFVFWVLVEDSGRRTPAVTEVLRRSGLRHVHLLGEERHGQAVL